MPTFLNSVFAPFRRSLELFQERNAFCIDGIFYSYRQLGERIDALSPLIKGVENPTVGIYTYDHLDTYAAIWACWLNGKSYVPLNPNSPEDLNHRVKQEAGISFVLDATQTALQYESGQVYSVLHQLDEISEDDSALAYILFTSGSTGVPKGVPITRGNIAAFVDAFYKMGYEISEEDRVLQMFELTFDLSVMSYLIPALHGACTYTIPSGRIKFAYIFELLDEHQLTIALMVPSMLNFLRPYFDEIDCPHLRYSLFCGEALYLDVLQEWSACVPNARIDNVYGPTENTIFCTYYTYNRIGDNPANNGILNIGKSMANSICTVMSESNQPAQVGELGELCLAGDQLTIGYLNNPSLNEKAFFETKNSDGRVLRYYRSGDLCTLGEDGNLMYAGRKDSQVKIQGFRVELSEIEFQAKAWLNGKLGVVAYTQENEQGINELYLVVESEVIDTNALKEGLKSKLPAYMIPKAIYFMAAFPLNVNGKVDRKAIKQTFQSHAI